MANGTLTYNDDRQEVAGVIASSALDRDDEVFDYENSKPYIKAWSDAVHAATVNTVGEDGASLGNVRLMHTKQVAGKLIDIKFDDAKKVVWGVAKVTDPKVWQDIKSGVYSAFSVGANLVNAAYKDGKKHLTIKPVEVSIVDYPANPDTTFDWIKGTASYVNKFAGSAIPPDAPVEQTVPPPPSPLGAPDAMQSESQADYEKRAFSDEKRQELADKGHALPDGSFPIENTGDLKNAIHAIGRAKDPAKAKDHIKARAKALGEESLIPDTWKSAQGAIEMNLTQEQKDILTKAADIFKLDVMKAGRASMADHLQNLKKAATAHKDAAVKHEADVHELCDKCMKMAGGDLLLAPSESEGGQKVDVGEAVNTAVKAAIAEYEKAAKVTTDKLTADLATANTKLADIEKAANKATGDRTNVDDKDKNLTPVEKAAAAKKAKEENSALAKAAWMGNDLASQRELFKKLAVVTRL
jgi:hypothetical protein